MLSTNASMSEGPAKPNFSVGLGSGTGTDCVNLPIEVSPSVRQHLKVGHDCGQFGASFPLPQSLAFRT